jgi:hypothetical protein
MQTSLREHASEVKAVRRRAVRRPRAAMGAPVDLGNERRRSDVSRTGIEGAGHVHQRAYPTLARASISAPGRAQTRVPPDPHRSGTADPTGRHAGLGRARRIRRGLVIARVSFGTRPHAAGGGADCSPSSMPSTRRRSAVGTRYELPMWRTRHGNSSRLASSYAVDRPRPRARAAVVMSMTTGSASNSARVRPSFGRPVPSDVVVTTPSRAARDSGGLPSERYVE